MPRPGGDREPARRSGVAPMPSPRQFSASPPSRTPPPPSLRPSHRVARDPAVGAREPSLTPGASRAQQETPVAEGVTVTIMFTDLVGSTRLALRLGDRRWLPILIGHEELVQRHARAHEGSVLKSQGDGFMLAFPSARAGLRCAISMQQDLAARSEGPRAYGLQMRIGLHTGEALRRGSDFHGRCVVLAARLAQHARSEEILVSSVVRDLVRGVDETEFDGGRELRLEGFPEAEWAFAVRWGAGRAPHERSRRRHKTGGQPSPRTGRRRCPGWPGNPWNVEGSLAHEDGSSPGFQSPGSIRQRSPTCARGTKPVNDEVPHEVLVVRSQPAEPAERPPRWDLLR